jgi:cation diffusion facilitator family transporter
LSDAATSIAAIIALVFARLFSFTLLDPIMGIAGGVLICIWGYGLIRDTSRILLDREMDSVIVVEIRDTIESDSDSKVRDLHVWRVGRSKFACAISVVTSSKKTPSEYQSMLNVHEEIAHTTIEVINVSPGGL